LLSSQLELQIQTTRPRLLLFSSPINKNEGTLMAKLNKYSVRVRMIRTQIDAVRRRERALAQIQAQLPPNATLDDQTRRTLLATDTIGLLLGVAYELRRKLRYVVSRLFLFRNEVSLALQKYWPSKSARVFTRFVSSTTVRLRLSW
jgi:hypothetical protein